MIYEVIIEKETYSDLDEIIEWHENKRKNLGIELLVEFNQVAELISKTPQIFKKDYLNFRKALLKRFPYTFHYSINETLGTVNIVGIFHSSRNPKESKKRINGKK